MPAPRSLPDFLPVPVALATLALLFALPQPAARAADDGAWLRLEHDSTHPASPSARREYAAIYDGARGRYVIFGGFGFQAPDPGGLFLEAWTLSLGGSPAWSPLVTAGDGPGERHSPQWGYDPARNRLIVFGGYGHHLPGGPNAYLNDVWELTLDDPPTWKEIVPADSFPSGRLAGASIYDPLRQRFVVFGGTVGATVDTYVLELSDAPVWKILPTVGAPPFAGYGMTAIHDPVRDRLVMFGGSTSDNYFGVHDDVWALDLSGTPTWTHLEPTGTRPSARRTLTSIYDPPRDRMVIFGGWDSRSNDTTSFLDDTWALSLGDEPAWTHLDPAGPIPVGRDAMAAAYDPEADRMVVFGGWSGNLMLGDTWFLRWGHPHDHVGFTPSATAAPGLASVRWGVTDASGTNAAVFRRPEGGEWSSVAIVQRTASGDVEFEDPTVTPGARYAYLAAVPSPRGPEFGGEVWVDVPTTIGVTPGPALALALRPVQPNPVVGRCLVSFTLPGAGRANLALYNIAGRKLLGQEVGSLGAGPHQVELAGAGALAPGLYFLQLAQGGQARTQRVVVIGE